ncbi:preprotein translocase subunit SecY [Candidatus Pacearchaeota archaeon]|nr:preprotein translocase subunit SecY [Candidatus Pacearchaeota archaeon]MBD3282785.1 preprotein translocase subunit SecY [Candidatus Pacearchaeota archaeon]
MAFKDILKNLPEVEGPTEKKLSFNIKLKWTLIILGAYFIMSNISLYGLEKNALERFEYLAIIMGTNFGSIISLGIGPIVMASIILQLLVGSKIIEIDTSTAEGKRFFQGLQKLLVLFFIVFEALVYVLMRGLEAIPGFTTIVIFQLILGGLAILFMDEVSTKWGFGSGVSLFIAAGVGWRLVTASFGFLGPQGNFQASGAVIAFIISLMRGDSQGTMLSLAAILATVILFLVVVWAQSLKIEIPLSYDRLRGYSLKWPLQFFYASVIPVILTAALIANLQLFGGLLQNWLGHPTIFANVVNGRPVSGFLYWVSSTNIVERIIQGSWEWRLLGQTIGHVIFFMFFAALFSVFWVKTSGMDASSQAENIIKSGLQIPGFRKDKRILESILSRYIMPLTIMGGIAIGLLAALADVLGALVAGTALLLGIMITFQFYQNIAEQHAVDMNPAMKKMMGV